MLHIITFIAIVGAVALGIYIAYAPYDEDPQYVAMAFAVLVPAIVLSIGVDLAWN